MVGLVICHILIFKLKISQNIIFRKKLLPQLLQPLFGIRLMMRVFLSITALNIVIDSQNIKFLLKLTFLNLDLMVSLWLIVQPLLLMHIVFRQYIDGFLGHLIGWKDKSKIKKYHSKVVFFIGFM